MKLFVVAEVLDFDGNEWELIGVFSKQDFAVSVCKDHTNYCIIPVDLDRIYTDKQVPEGSYYPNFDWDKLRKFMESEGRYETDQRI
jgi:hypothetical protein